MHLISFQVLKKGSRFLHLGIFRILCLQVFFTLRILNLWTETHTSTCKYSMELTQYLKWSIKLSENLAGALHYLPNRQLICEKVTQKYHQFLSKVFTTDGAIRRSGQWNTPCTNLAIETNNTLVTTLVSKQTFINLGGNPISMFH
jgi:hypothetical protein